MKSFRRKDRIGTDMEITPLMDVMFMLLIFFLLTSSFMKPSISLKLPEAGNRDKSKKQEITVTADHARNIFLNRERVNIAELETLLKEKLLPKDKKNVIFQGDEDIPYSLFVKLMDIIKKSGAKEIGIAHDSEI